MSLACCRSSFALRDRKNRPLGYECEADGALAKDAMLGMRASVNPPPPKGGGFGLRLKAGLIGPGGRLAYDREVIVRNLRFLVLNARGPG